MTASMSVSNTAGTGSHNMGSHNMDSHPTDNRHTDSLKERVMNMTFTTVCRTSHPTERAELVTIDHAALAMQAAKKIRRARRQSQKEKMGHAVCHHLLRMLEKDDEPTAREKRLAASAKSKTARSAQLDSSLDPAARRLAAKADEPQLSMSF